MDETKVAVRDDIGGSDARGIAARIWQALTFGGRLGRRPAIVIWLFLGVALPLFLGWNWVVAAGVSSLVLAVLPCAAMCALGLCVGSANKCTDKIANPPAPKP